MDEEALEEALERAMDEGATTSDVSLIARRVTDRRKAASKKVVVKLNAPLYVVSDTPPEGKFARLCVGRVGSDITATLRFMKFYPGAS